MVSANIDAKLALCDTPGRGCLAADPGVIDALFLTDDHVMDARYKAIAKASHAAGQNGTPLEEISYLSGPQESQASLVSDLVSGDYVDRLGYKIAQCAYVCGSCAVSYCPMASEEIFGTVEQATLIQAS